ncbi:MAG TPA: hypothetical protein VMI13_09800 [Solirubrobacteraceae bacterium]|nr:hypothetical protein [Solirubrobacteraceae bacterium]
MSALARAIGAGLALVGAATVLAGPGARPATADIFGPIELVTAGTLGAGQLQQAEYAHDSVICADGAYVVFDGSVGGVTGVWRVNLATREMQQVASGDALLPSVSADGRYVSFTTNQSEAQLAADTRGLAGEPPVSEAEATPGPENVYVRDMDVPPGEPGAFTVASAANGSGEPLSYTEAGIQLGSVASGGSAISADGREVAFVTTAVSNLAGPETPAMQVAVRRLESRETTLVSGEYEPATGQTGTRPVSAGGRGAAYGDVVKFPSQDPEYSRWTEARPPGAVISADGTTVAWMGVNIGLQARMLPGEAPLSEYTEPLWRRIAAPETATERITGGSDPADPACAASGEAALPAHPSPSDPCEGPFLTHPGEAEPGSGVGGIFSQRGEAKTSPGEFVPRLSADGYTVAFLSRAEPTGLGEFFNTERERGEQADIYVVDMRPGLTRDGALTTLTRIGGASGAESDGISEFALAEDGRTVAFTTRRTEFRLAFPAFVSAALAEPGLGELFYVDLGDGTLTRVTRGYGGEPSEQPHQRKTQVQEDPYEERPTAGATSPSFAEDGSLLAFASTASNLVPYDGNGPQTLAEIAGQRDGSDTFVVSREIPSALPTPQYISPAPPGVDSEPAWTLGATALGRSDGSVALYLRVPGQGSLSASARSAIVVRTSRGHARHARAAKARRKSAAETVTTRTVASAHSSVAPNTERLMLVLRPQRAYAGLAARAGGLSATVAISFAAARHAVLRQVLQVTFLKKVHSGRTRHAGKSSHRRHGG